MTKDQAAQELALAHVAAEPGIEKIFRIRSPREEAETEPVKLLEVNPDTTASGVVPIMFSSDSSIPYPSGIIEITPLEFHLLEQGKLALPAGWRLGEELYEQTGASASGRR